MPLKQGLANRYRRVEFYLRGRLNGRNERQYPLQEHINALLDWLLRAQAATPDDGVAGSFHYPTQCWTPSYPETTGYIICSMFRAANAGFGNCIALRDSALRMANWLACIQMPEGSFQGGHVGIKSPKPAVFNTGQVLKGLTDSLTESPYESGTIWASAERAARWLMANQDADGAWRKGNSVLTTEPVHAYDVRTAWALARYGKRFNDKDAVNAGVRNAEWLMSIRHSDGWFPLMNFDVGVEPLLHSVAYTINGLLELGDLCAREEFIEAARLAAGRIASTQDPATGAVPGQLTNGYKPLVSWTNTTANSQMAIIWFRLTEITGEPYWTEYGRRANEFNRSLHEIESGNLGTRGAVCGSWPKHEGYGQYCYMNWTQKFFLDALLAETGLSIR
jgi:hypothetical protein